MSFISNGLIKFEGYEIDRARWQLSWRSESLPLNRKTFDLLVYLVDHANRVVGKDELLRALWPGSFVEESNLTQHIFLLRKALSRHASGTKIIETVPGRGYRFAALIDEPGNAEVREQVVIAASESITRFTIEEQEMDVPSDISSAGLRVPGSLRRRFLLTGASIAAFTIAVAGWFTWQHTLGHSRRAPVQRVLVPAEGSTGVPARQAVAVLGFRDLSNEPEDAWLSTAVAEMLATEMSAGDKLRVIPSEEIVRAQSDLGIRDSSKDSDTKRASLRQATGADMLIQGSYVAVGHGEARLLRLMVKVVDAHSGKQLAALSETGRLGDLFALVDQTGEQLRRNLSQEGSPAEDERALSGMSHSTEALRFYAEGLEAERAFDDHSAQSLFERAVDADPRFAMAHLGLADVWSNLGFMERASKEAAEAYQLSSNLPRAERLAVEADYRHFSHDDEHAISIYKSLSTFYPDDEKWGLKLAAAQRGVGKEKEALDTIERLRKLQLTPAETVESDGIEAVAYAYLDDAQANDKARTQLKEAIAIADKQGGLFIHGRAYRWVCYALSHIGPVPTAQAACEQSKTTFQAIGNLQGVEAATNNLGVLAQQIGDWKQAGADYEEARRLDHQLGSLEAETDTIQNLALVDLSQGDLPKSLRESTELSHITGTSDDYHTAYEGHHYATWALMLSGRLGEAKVEALKAQEAADKEHPWDFKVYQQARSRDDRAWVAYRVGDFNQARTLFQEAAAMVEPTHDDVGEAIFISDEAWVALVQGNPGNEFMARLRDAVAVLAKFQDVSDETIDAEVILARLDLQRGAKEEAAQAMAKAKMLDSKGDSLAAHMNVLLGDADLQQTLGHFVEAKKILQDEITSAKRHGFAYSDLAGEITSARLDAKIAPSSQNASHLQSLIREARRAGFAGLAGQSR
jgi:DNA-binding winged helix-turn-helix (wHTH) protein/tetratricopeptide (TPR) repeat protein